ncbi:MAG: dioxygenase [Austwickia sp.]|jgi:4,5-DOPA dioxygenase extradiol|nr:MAG: dioxygenase [Austwickia sp.]
MPTLFLSHGAPPLADDPIWPQQLAAWAGRLPRPTAILMVSAHWEERPPTLSSTTGAGLVYDFWGFPQRYYAVRYDAPPAPALADRVAELLADGPVAGAAPVPGAASARATAVRRDEARGLDHGAYVPLVAMYPAADIPVVQLSLPTLDPSGLLALGTQLAPLREEGVLIVGSGFTTHNLAWFAATGSLPDGANAPAPAVSAAFDAWAAEAMAAGDVAALLDAPRRAPDFAQAHPRSEHWAPLYVAVGAALRPGAKDTPDAPSTFDATCEIDGFWYGLSKRSWTFS